MDLMFETEDEGKDRILNGAFVEWHLNQVSGHSESQGGMCVK